MDEDTGDIICRGRTKTEGDWSGEKEVIWKERDLALVAVCVYMHVSQRSKG